MKDKIVKLIDLKTLITFSLTIAFIYGFIIGKITTDDFMKIVLMVFTFYFVKKD